MYREIQIGLNTRSAISASVRPEAGTTVRVVVFVSGIMHAVYRPAVRQIWEIININFYVTSQKALGLRRRRDVLL